jgi:tetratricopeptide (TPR) repeat protein
MFEYKTKFDTVKDLVEIAFNFAKENNLKIPYQLIWLNAEVAFREGNIYKASVSMEKALPEIEVSGKIKEIITARNFFARVLTQGGEFSKAIDMYKKNMKMARDNGMEDIYLESLNRLAEIYRSVGKIDESKKFYNSLFAEAVVAKDTFWLTEALFRLGIISMSVDSNFKLARKYFSDCIRIAEQQKDTSRICWTMNHLAWDYYLMDEKDSALACYNNLIKLATMAKLIGLVTNSLGNIGTIYRDKKEYQKAEKYYQKSIDFALSTRNMENLRWIHKDVSDMYLSLGDFKNAYYHYQQYNLYNDSLNSLKFKKGMTEARMKFDVDQQQKELEVLTIKLSQQRYLTYGFAAFIILFVIVGLLVIRQFRLSAKKRISEMNQRIAEMTQANLRQQMNPHFIFNTLNSIQYYMYQHDKVATNNYLTKFSSLIRKILENSQHTSIPIKDELEALTLYLELEKLRFKEKFSYRIDVADEIDTLQYKIPTMLIQPYVENAICHGLVTKDGSGYVNIAFSMEFDYIRCVIEDNGIGREAAMEIKKHRETNHNSLGTRITESRLDLVNSLYGTSLKVIYDDLKDEHGDAIGTRVEIHIPIMV